MGPLRPWLRGSHNGSPAHERVADVVAERFIEHGGEPTSMRTIENRLGYGAGSPVALEAAQEAERQGLVELAAIAPGRQFTRALQPTAKHLAALLAAARDYAERLEEQLTEA